MVVSYNSSRKSICGGSIINESYILTAAHCLDFNDVGAYRVRSGSLNAYFGGQEHEVEKLIKHECFLGNFSDDHDIALIKLKNHIVFDENRKMINFFNKNEETLENKTGLIVGWGTTESGKIPQVAHSVYWVNKNTCNDLYLKRFNGILKNLQICAGYFNDDDDGSRALCLGDSGSALVVDGRIAGVASWGPIKCGEPKSPEVFTEVAKYRTWIDGKIKGIKYAIMCQNV